MRVCVSLAPSVCACVCVWNIHIYDKCVCQAVKCVKNYVHIDTSYLILLLLPKWGKRQNRWKESTNRSEAKDRAKATAKRAPSKQLRSLTFYSSSHPLSLPIHILTLLPFPKVRPTHSHTFAIKDLCVFCFDTAFTCVDPTWTTQPPPPIRTTPSTRAMRCAKFSRELQL